MAKRRMGALLANALLTTALILAGGGPAAAGETPERAQYETAAHAIPAAPFLEGDVYNNLVTFTVHIASFSGSMATCFGWNQYGTMDVSYFNYSCTRYWLPYGKSDDDIRGNNFDADGFMVEQDYAVNMGGEAMQYISGGVWTKIRDNAAARCSYRSDLGRPLCHVWAKW